MNETTNTPATATEWTKLALALAVLAIASAMLWTKALDGAQWVSIASAVLWAYMLGQVAAIGANGLAAIGAAKSTEAQAKLVAVQQGRAS